MRPGFLLVLMALVAGCAGPGPVPLGGPDTGRVAVLKGDIFFRNGEFVRALEEYERYLDGGDGAFFDEALFRAGTIHLFYVDKHGAFDSARKKFAALVRDYPESPRAAEAENFLKILGKIGDLEKENLKLKADLQKMLDLDIQMEEKRKELKE